MRHSNRCDPDTDDDNSLDRDDEYPACVDEFLTSQTVSELFFRETGNQLSLPSQAVTRWDVMQIAGMIVGLTEGSGWTPFIDLSSEQSRYYRALSVDGYYGVRSFEDSGEHYEFVPTAIATKWVLLDMLRHDEQRDPYMCEDPPSR